MKHDLLEDAWKSITEFDEREEEVLIMTTQNNMKTVVKAIYDIDKKVFVRKNYVYRLEEVFAWRECEQN